MRICSLGIAAGGEIDGVGGGPGSVEDDGRGMGGLAGGGGNVRFLGARQKKACAHQGTDREGAISSIRRFYFILMGGGYW